jgi:hypothetical protein
VENNPLLDKGDLDGNPFIFNNGPCIVCVIVKTPFAFDGIVIAFTPGKCLLHNCSKQVACSSVIHAAHLLGLLCISFLSHQKCESIFKYKKN